MKIPIALNIDDPAPVISVYHAHADTALTKDGRALAATYSNELLFRFCDIIEKHGMKGKFSVVPMPANKGDIIHGIEGVPQKDVNAWLDAVTSRVAPRFSICPEILSHHMAVDLSTGKALEVNEKIWSRSQDKTTLTPYIALALSLLQQAGLHPSGVTSPWNFGITVEEEYVASIAQAVFDVTGKEQSWYFLHSLRNQSNARPWVAYDEGGKSVVSIPATTTDHIWQTIDTADTSEELVLSIADKLITADGRDGEIVRVIEGNGYPIVTTHWQSLMSNGLGTGLRILEKVAARVNQFLGDIVEWMSFEQILQLVLADKAAYPKPPLP
ncbi:MAG: hypothetical protein IJW22_04480 [Clostridia bacterium]|nr:hypothetical protein [Clostridia bacterium]